MLDKWFSIPKKLYISYHSQAARRSLVENHASLPGPGPGLQVPSLQSALAAVAGSLSSSLGFGGWRYLSMGMTFSNDGTLFFNANCWVLFV